MVEQYHQQKKQIERLRAALEAETICSTCSGSGLMGWNCEACEEMGYKQKGCACCHGTGTCEDTCAECNGEKRSFRSDVARALLATPAATPPAAAEDKPYLTSEKIMDLGAKAKAKGVVCMDGNSGGPPTQEHPDTARLNDVIRRATAPMQGVTFYRKITTGKWQYQERDEEGYMNICGEGETQRDAIDAARTAPEAHDMICPRCNGVGCEGGAMEGSLKLHVCPVCGGKKRISAPEAQR